MKQFQLVELKQFEAILAYAVALLSTLNLVLDVTRSIDLGVFNLNISLLSFANQTALDLSNINQSILVNTKAIDSFAAKNNLDLNNVNDSIIQVTTSIHDLNFTTTIYGEEIHDDLLGIDSQLYNLHTDLETVNETIIKFASDVNDSFVLAYSLSKQIDLHVLSVNYTLQQNAEVLNENFRILLSKMDEIITALAGVVLKDKLVSDLNDAVGSIESASSATVSFDGDACEYDPLGFGPINCDGVETEGSILNSVKFVKQF